MSGGETLFGPVEKGEQFDYRGLIMHDIRAGRFSHIVVSYNSFTNTRLDGRKVEMGLPHRGGRS